MARRGGDRRGGGAGRTGGTGGGRGRAAAVLLRGAGELFITLGAVLLLFVAYQLWWTNVAAEREARGAVARLEEQWKRQSDGGATAGGGGGAGRTARAGAGSGAGSGDRAAGGEGASGGREFAAGEGFAVVTIPRIGLRAPVAEGTGKQAVLDKGLVGHYGGDGGPESAMPWDRTGNVGLAAHRTTHGQPFRRIGELRPGDAVVLETAEAYYTYEVVRTLPQTPPSNTRVLDPVPRQAGFTRPGRYLTLTTCTPEFSARYRLVVWGKMVDERPRSKGKPEALLTR